jgi:pyruvate formate lyase activating enzyme
MMVASGRQSAAMILERRRPMHWRDEHRPAALGEALDDGRVRCGLCPRNCTIPEGCYGLCGVRGNRDGVLVTFTYGKGVGMTEEVIETEAINHYAPGARILSCGNIGCNLSCRYCQNWKTSQAAYVDDKDVRHYTPEEVVATAQRHGVGIMSWTYNEPVVWHEFVVETARLAKEVGLINLFKSAFFITPRAAEQLLPHVDIFSISVKSMDPEYYRSVTQGRLEPILAGAKLVFDAGKHVEVSTLMVTGLTDNDATAHAVSSWLLHALGPEVPLHFVRFHPEFRYQDTTRTPIEHLKRARATALSMGVLHVYVGNVHDPSISSSFCSRCRALLVHRYGLVSQTVGLDGDGHCLACGTDAHFRLRPTGAPRSLEAVDPSLPRRTYGWRGDVRSVHIQVRNTGTRAAQVFHRHRLADGSATSWAATDLGSLETYRFVAAKSADNDSGVEVAAAADLAVGVLEVYDRAHFPTVTTDEVAPDDDVTPYPRYAGS